MRMGVHTLMRLKHVHWMWHILRLWDDFLIIWVYIMKEFLGKVMWLFDFWREWERSTLMVRNVIFVIMLREMESQIVVK